ncbi:MAG: sugar phosphate isomerase/epimerase [Planctomycetes bacterium]|nr:sugar phosphate isomerase/epimerase [Planctomycetota bacterium]
MCNETFRDWPFDKAFAFAAECGYKGIEIAPFTISNYVTDVSAGKRQEIRKQAKAAGLDIIALHWLLARTKGLHLTSPDRDVRRKTSQYLGDLARFCADLGGDLLVFGSPRQRNLQEGVSRDDGFKFATEVIQEALPILEKVNVRLALEPLSHQITNFFATADEAVELIKRIDSPRCQLILDCVAMASESKTAVELIRQHHKRLVHFHANDPNSQGPGFGKLDFVPIFQALREVKFSGWVSVEVFDYAPGPERLAKESIQYMKKCVAKTK